MVHSFLEGFQRKDCFLECGCSGFTKNMEGCCIKNRNINQDPDRKDHGNIPEHLWEVSFTGETIWVIFQLAMELITGQFCWAPGKAARKRAHWFAVSWPRTFSAESLYFMPQYVTKTWYPPGVQQQNQPQSDVSWCLPLYFGVLKATSPTDKSIEDCPGEISGGRPVEWQPAKSERKLVQSPTHSRIQLVTFLVEVS